MNDVLRWARHFLSAAGVVSAAGAATAWVSTSVPAPAEASQPTQLARTTAPSRQPVDSFLAAIYRAAPFRRGRNPLPAAGPPVSTTPVVRPVLTMLGTVGGSAPAVIVEGIPGVEGGRLLYLGDSAGGLRILWIRDSRAGIAGFDTSWTLELKAPR